MCRRVQEERFGWRHSRTKQTSRRVYEGEYRVAAEHGQSARGNPLQQRHVRLACVLAFEPNIEPGVGGQVPQFEAQR